MALRTPSRLGPHPAPVADGSLSARCRRALARPPRASLGAAADAEHRAVHRLRATLGSLRSSPAQFWTQLLAAAVVLAYTASTVLVARPPSGYDSIWDGWIGNIASILPIDPDRAADREHLAVPRARGSRCSSGSACTTPGTSSTSGTTRT